MSKRHKEKQSEKQEENSIITALSVKEIQADSISSVLTCADAAGLLVKTAGALGVGSRKLCGVTSVLGMKPGTAVGLGIPWLSFLSGFIY